MSNPDQPADPPRARGSAPLPPRPPTYEDGPTGAGRPQSPDFAWGVSPPVTGGPAGGMAGGTAGGMAGDTAEGVATPGAPAPGWLPRPAPPGGVRRIAVPVLSGVAALLLVAASAAGYLWWATATELDETRAELTAQVAELTGTIEENDAEIGRLNDDLQAVEDELGETETQLEGTRNMIDQLEDEQGVIRRCITLSREAQEAVLNNDQAAFNAVIEEATEVCAEADAILGF